MPNLQLHVAALLAIGGPKDVPDRPAPIGRGAEPPPDERLVVVPVPSQLPRLVPLPAEKDVHLARVEDVIAANLSAMFPGCEVAAAAAFRIARDADVVLQDDEEIEDLLHAMEEVVLSRRRRTAVRLTISAGCDPRLKQLAGRLAQAGRRRGVRDRRPAGGGGADGVGRPAADSTI